MIPHREKFGTYISIIYTDNGKSKKVTILHEGFHFLRGADGCFFILLFLKERFYFFLLVFYFFMKNLIAWGGQDSLNFWEIRISKKNTSVDIFAIFFVTTVWLQGDSRAKLTYRFFKNSWPLFWRSHSFLRKSTDLLTDIFKDNLDIGEDNRKKSQFSHVEIIISMFFISITMRCTIA